MMDGPGASAPIDKSAPTHRIGEDRSRTVRRKSGGDHVSSQVSQAPWAVVAEAGTGSSREWGVVAE